MKRNDVMHLKARETLQFLECHPALGSPIFSPLMLMHINIAQVCKEGHVKAPHGGGQGLVDI